MKLGIHLYIHKVDVGCPSVLMSSFCRNPAIPIDLTLPGNKPSPSEAHHFFVRKVYKAVHVDIVPTVRLSLS